MISPEITKHKKADKSTQFAMTVTQFGLLLKDSQYKHKVSYKNVIELAKLSKGKDTKGLRTEFINLVITSKAIDENLANK